MVLLFFVSAVASPGLRQDSLLTIARDESRPVKNRLSSFADLVVHYGKTDPVKALELGKEGLILFNRESLSEELARLNMNMAFVHYASLDYEHTFAFFEEAARIYNETGKIREEVFRQRKRKDAFIRWLGVDVSAAILLLLFIFYYRLNMKDSQRCRDRLRGSAEEMVLLRQKIEDYDTLVPREYTIKRKEVNFFLKKALSNRELDVFMLLLKGFPNHKIAEHLFVSVNTVKFHLQNIYVKLDVKNRAEAILFISKG